MDAIKTPVGEQVLASARTGQMQTVSMAFFAALLQDCWQPISTAPKSGLARDGSVQGVYLLMFEPLSEEDGFTDDDDVQIGIQVAWWEPHMNQGQGCWYNGTTPVHPTHWMPLPIAPHPGLMRVELAPEGPVSAPSAAATAIAG